VFLHGLVRDATGAKMSKTRGNTMDPLELLERYGTDALRFALTTGTAPGNDLRFTEGRLESARNFANKVWNAARFVLTSLDGKPGLDGWFELPEAKHREDRWILSRLERTTAEVNQALENFELGEAQQKLHDFIWNDFCDWYIEMAKIRLRSGNGASPLPVLAHVLERTLRLLHPFMPFITEEIWQNLLTRLPREGELPQSIMVSPYPKANGARQDSQAESEISLVMQTIHAVRNARAQLRIPANQRLEAVVEGNGAQGTGVHQAIEEEADVIRGLSRVEPLRVQFGDPAGADAAKGVTLVVTPLVVRLPLEGVVDLGAEAARLREERDDCLRNLDRVSALVSNPNFRAKARPDVVESEQERLRSLEERKQRLEEILEQLGG
jgi:valyl-tRNA synthetase